MGIPASKRLRQQPDFLRVRADGTRVHCGPFIAQCLRREVGSGRRIGIIASRRVGNAVCRNRCKRRMREAVRLEEGGLPADCDLVLVLRRQMQRHPWTDLRHRLRKACHRFGGAGEESRGDRPDGTEGKASG